jgi:hypothetical protein
MGSKTLQVTLTASCLVGVALAAYPVCPCWRGQAADQLPPEQYEQIQRLYRHTNTLVKTIEARNNGKLFEQWTPGDQDMHKNRTEQMRELVQSCPRLADDPVASTVIEFCTGDPER